MFHVLIPYLAVVKQLHDDDTIKLCREFLENCCENHGKCDKVYDSWMRSTIKSARGHGFRGFGLGKFKEKNPDIEDIVEKVLDA